MSLLIRNTTDCEIHGIVSFLNAKGVEFTMSSEKFMGKKHGQWTSIAWPHDNA